MKFEIDDDTLHEIIEVLDWVIEFDDENDPEYQPWRDLRTKLINLQPK
jgi:hypothetical protein